MSAFNKFLYKIYRLQWVITRPVTLGVRLLLIKDGQVLLVKPTYLNGWYFVGGGVKRNETLEQAARREAQEEIGAELGRLELFGIFTLFNESKSDHIAVFECTDFTYTGKTDFEIEQSRFFPLDSLPADIAPGHERRIQEYLEGQDRPNYGYW
jgi:ADP-ribose pyrophosphatase YjhB (NUDIX family)